MTKKWKPRKYSGELIKPIETNSEFWGAELSRARGDRVKLMEITARSEADFIAKFNAKMLLLLDEFKIPRDAPNRWERLSGELACAHVPALGSDDHGGRPKKWTELREMQLSCEIALARLSIAIEKKCNPDEVNIVDAIRRIIKNDPGKWGRNETSIHKRYNEAFVGPRLPSRASLGRRSGSTEK
jgi:hypothetical protein